MRRRRPTILLVLAILAAVQNIIWSVPAYAQVPLQGSSVNLSDTHQNLEKYRLRGAELEKVYEQTFLRLVDSTRAIAPVLSEKLKENFFGINWYFADLGLKNESKNEIDEQRPSGDIWSDQKLYLSKTTAQRTEFFLKHILIYEFQRTHGQLPFRDEDKLNKVLQEIFSPQATIDSLESALDQADLLQSEKHIWSNQLFLQDPTIPNNHFDGVLFSRKGLRFLMRHCQNEALFDIHTRQLEATNALRFAGMNVLLERLSRSGVCTSIDHKLYTVPLKAVQMAENKIRLDLKRQVQESRPIFWTSWFAWIGTFELVVNSQVIRIVRQPALKRFIFEIILGGLLGGTAAVTYKVMESKKTPVSLLSTESQLKLLADLNRAMTDAPIGYYKMSTSDFLSQTQKNLTELAGHGFLEMVLLKRPNK